MKSILLLLLFIQIYSQSIHWWDTHYRYRKKIQVINETGQDLTDFQVFISIADLNIPSGKRRDDYGDIRFTDYSGTTVFNYWLDKSTGFWIKIKDIPSGTTDIFVYYGNPYATSMSDGKKTFEFFDDFKTISDPPWHFIRPTLGKGTTWTIVADEAAHDGSALKHNPTTAPGSPPWWNAIATAQGVVNGITEARVKISTPPCDVPPPPPRYKRLSLFIRSYGVYVSSTVIQFVISNDGGIDPLTTGYACIVYEEVPWTKTLLAKDPSISFDTYHRLKVYTTELQYSVILTLVPDIN